MQNHKALGLLGTKFKLDPLDFSRHFFIFYFLFFYFLFFLFFVGDCHGPFYGITPMKIEFHVYFINVWKVESISIGMTLFDVINVCDTREESDESHNHS